MQRILIVGCGDVALRWVRSLQAAPNRSALRFYALVRSEARIPTLRDAGIVPIRGDLDDRASLKKLVAVAPVMDVILHLAPPPPEGETDPRMRRLLAALARVRHSARLVYVSTTGVYGDGAGGWVTETWPARPSNARARRRQDAEQQLRQWAGRHHVGAMLLRAPGIYAADRLPADRVRRGLPALLPAEDIFTNHIHADDLGRLLWRAAYRGHANRLYNAVDQSSLKMGDWFDVVADYIGVARPPRQPRAKVMAAVSPAMRTFLADSRRVGNHRVVNELDFCFRYPTVRAALCKDGKD